MISDTFLSPVLLPEKHQRKMGLGAKAPFLAREDEHMKEGIK